MRAWLVTEGRNQPVGIFQSKLGADRFVEMLRANHEGIWSLETTKKYDIWTRISDSYNVKIEEFKVHP